MLGQEGRNSRLSVFGQQKSQGLSPCEMWPLSQAHFPHSSAGLSPASYVGALKHLTRTPILRKISTVPYNRRGRCHRSETPKGFAVWLCWQHNNIVFDMLCFSSHRYQGHHTPWRWHFLSASMSWLLWVLACDGFAMLGGPVSCMAWRVSVVSLEHWCDFRTHSVFFHIQNYIGSASNDIITLLWGKIWSVYSANSAEFVGKKAVSLNSELCYFAERVCPNQVPSISYRVRYFMFGKELDPHGNVFAWHKFTPKRFN